MSKAVDLPSRHRLLGLFPLVFFCGQLYRHWSQGAPSNILWMCNISNLTLALGLILNIQMLIGISVLWLIIGFPLWIIDLVQFGEKPIITFIAHIGSLTIVLIVLLRISIKRNTWLYSFGWFLFLQQVCRMFTPASLNVNLAHSPRGVPDKVLSSYWQYWIASTLLAAFSLFVLEKLLLKLPKPAAFRRAS